MNDLINPINFNKLDTNKINFFSGIPDLYFDDQNPLTMKQSEFYNDVKFPNYDDIEDFGEPTPRRVRQRGVPAGRWGRVEDISLAAVYMCTDAGGWITATRLTIDGGAAHRSRGFVEAKNAIEKKSLEQKAKFSGGVAKL